MMNNVKQKRLHKNRMSFIKNTWQIFVLLFFITSSVVHAQAKFSDDTPPEMRTLLEKGKLVVAMTEKDQRPFYFINKKGELDGLDVYIAKEMAAQLGVDIEFRRTAQSFNDTVDMVAKGEADVVISKLSRTLTRAKFVKFSAPYIVLKQALLLNRLELAKRTPENQTRKFIRNFQGKMGVIENSSYVNYAKKNFPNAQIVEYPSWDEVVQAVMKGEVLAAYRDDLEINKVLDSYPDASIKLKQVLFSDLTDPIAIAIRYDRMQLLSWISIFLDSLHLDYTSRSLLEEYKGK